MTMRRAERKKRQSRKVKSTLWIIDLCTSYNPKKIIKKRKKGRITTKLISNIKEDLMKNSTSKTK